MIDFVTKLFDTTGFPPRWYCGTWTDGHGWLHVVSDSAICGAYFAIPVVLAYFIMRRGDVPFTPILWLFAAFILSCGIGHGIEASIFWQPWYRFSGVVKLITALVSWATVLALIPIVPKALALPKLAVVNAQLEQEVNDRIQADQERAKYEAELERSNRELDEFAYSASHDLKAPLRAIQNLAGWLKEDSKGALPSECDEHIRLIEARIARMNRLLDDMLAYSKVDRVEHSRESVDVAELVRDQLSLLNVPDGFSIEVRDLPRLMTFRAPLGQVFRNLIGNAIKHHERTQGTITIRAQETNNGLWEFSVEDDGPGIPEEYQERVFEMFQTLKSRDEVEGSGMGLALVRRIVHTHSGQLNLTSSTGAGTTISFTWPEESGETSRTGNVEE